MLLNVWYLKIDCEKRCIAKLKDFMNNTGWFSDDDIENALNFYQESFITFPKANWKK